MHEEAVQLSAEEERALLLGEDHVEQRVQFDLAGSGSTLALDDLVVEERTELLVARGVVGCGEQRFRHDGCGTIVLAEAPSREDTGGSLYILFGVTTGLAQRVQFHQLTRVVLIGCSGHVLVAIEVLQHAWIDGDVVHQLPEIA